MDDLQAQLRELLPERYRILQPLGEGGAGVVFLAADAKLQRKVAIKVLRPEIGRELGKERFEREIQIAAQLSHQNILSLIDSGTAGDLLYYVMFYVEGESLRHRLNRERQLPIEDAIRITCEAADALHHAHEAGLIHRDVKPENILLEGEHALVCDFGIARAVGEAGSDRITHTGVVVGTPAYMSPEQAVDDHIDRRSDIYSLACVLYEMLVGAPPFSGATPQAMLARKAAQPAPSASVVRETVPDHVEQALRRALARVPADRFGTARDFQRALTGEAAFTPLSTERIARPLGSQWRGVLAGMTATIAVIALVAFGLGRRSAESPTNLSFSPVTAQPGLEAFPSVSPDGEWVVYQGQGDGHTDIFLRGITGQLAINLTEDAPSDETSPAFSTDGERIAFRSSREGGGIFIMGRTGEAVRRVTDRGFNPAWSPDGTRIAFADEHVEVLPENWEGLSKLWIVEIETGEITQLSEFDGVQPAWSPDGRWIAYTARMTEAGHMDIRVVSIEGGPSMNVTDDIVPDWSPTWSPDGRYLYFSSKRGGSMNLWRIPMDSSDGRPTGPPQPVTTPASFAAHPSVSADGAVIAFTSVQTTQNVYSADFDPETGEMADPELLTTGSREWSSPDPSPDGSLVAFYSRNLPEGDLYVVRADGSGLRQVTADSATDRMPRWSSDGARITYFSNRSGPLQLWSIRPDGSGNTQLTERSAAAWVVWSPENDRLAINGTGTSVDGQNVRLTSVTDPDDSSRLLPDWGGENEWFSANDWSPDGTRLIGMLGTYDRGVIVYHLAEDRYEQLTDFGQWPVWLPDGRRALFVTGGERYYLLDTQTGETRLVHEELRAIAGPPRLSDNGRMVVFTLRRSEGDIWAARIGGD